MTSGDKGVDPGMVETEEVPQRRRGGTPQRLVVHNDPSQIGSLPPGRVECYLLFIPEPLQRISNVFCISLSLLPRPFVPTTLVVVVVTALQMPDGGRGRIRFHKKERLRHWVIVSVAAEPEFLPALHFGDS